LPLQRGSGGFPANKSRPSQGQIKQSFRYRARNWGNFLQADPAKDLRRVIL
jgi:hypothetical protein